MARRRRRLTVANRSTTKPETGTDRKGESKMINLKGFDTPCSVLGNAKAIKAAGYDFVIRYISPDTQNFRNKQVTPTEIKELHANGVAVGFVWETLPTNADYFDEVRAGADATEAILVLTRLGVPKSVEIAFTVDYDAQPGDQGRIDAYFAVVQKRMKAVGWLEGDYGSRAVIAHLQAKGLAHDGWQSLSKGWRDGNAEPTMIQLAETKILGLDCDTDTATSTAFLWMP